MCEPLTGWVAQQCDRFRNGGITVATLDKYKQIGKLTQAQYDTILDTECPCGWIVPTAMAAPEA